MEQNYTSLIEVFKKITTTTHEQFGKIYKENIFTDPTANLIVDGLVVQSKFIRNIVINGCGGTGAAGRPGRCRNRTHPDPRSRRGWPSSRQFARLEDY